MALSLLPAMGPAAQAADDTEVVSDDYQTVEAYVNDNKPYVDGTGEYAVPITVKSTSLDALYGNNVNDWEKRIYYVYGLSATLGATGSSATVGTSYMAKGYNSSAELYYDEINNGFVVLNEYPVRTNVYVSDEKVIAGTSAGTSGTLNDWATFVLPSDKAPATQFEDKLSAIGTQSGAEYVYYDFETSPYYATKGGTATTGWIYNFEAGPNEFTVTATIGVYNYTGRSQDTGAVGQVGDLISDTKKSDSRTITIYAPYTLTLNLNDGTGNTFSEAVTYKDGCYVFPTEVPTRDGYVFAGWNTKENGTGDSYSAGDEIPYYLESDGSGSLAFNNHTTLYAQWWKITYDGNEPEGAGVANNVPEDTDTEVNESGELVIPEQEPTLEDYTFLGWNTEEDGSGTWYKGGGKANAAGTLSDPKGTMTVTEDTTLYAQWQASDQYIVILKDPENISYEKTATVTGNSYTFPTAEAADLDEIVEKSTCEYHFAGWQVSGDTSITYQPGDPYSLEDSVTTFTAVWEKYYVVTFDSNLEKAGNETLENPSAWFESFKVKDGDSFNLPSAETWTTNYKLTGWSTTESSSSQYNPGAEVKNLTQNTTYYAQWTKSGRIIAIQGCSGVEANNLIEPTIVFRVPGSTSDVTLTVTYNGTEKYFNGTSGNSDFKALNDGTGMYYVQMDPTLAYIGQKLKAELTCYNNRVLTWSDTMEVTITGKETDPATPGVTQYTVTYLPGTYEGDAVVAQNMPGSGTVTEGKTYYVDGNTPTAAGYTFKGWKLDNTDTIYNPGQQITDVQNDITLTAVWQKIGTVSITYAANAGSDTTNNIPSGTTAEQGSSYTIPSVVPTRKGYTFTGWKDNNTNKTYQPGDTIAVGTSDIALTAQWSQNTVTLTWDTLPTGVTDTDWGTTTSVNEGSTVSFTLDLDESYDPGTLTVTANGVALAGVKGADGKYTYSFQANSNTAIAVSTPSKLTYTVVLPSGNFTAFFANEYTTSKTVEYGDDYSFTVTPHTGYKVLGIYVNGGTDQKGTAAADGTYTVTVGEVKTAQNIRVDVETIPTYTVTFIVPVTGQTFTQSVAEGSKATKPVDPVKEGYTFEGWYTQEQYPDGTEYTFNDTVTGNLVLYGKLKANEYKITYDANGGTGEPSEQTKTYGVALTLDSTVPTRTGYRFLGWATTKDATAAVYQPGQPFSTELSGDITLYAVWEQLTYTVTLPSGTGYSVGTTQSTTVPYGEDFTFTVTVDRDYAATAPKVTVGTSTEQLAAKGEPTTNDDGSKTYTYTITGIMEDKVVSVTVLKNSIYTVTYRVDGATYQTAQVPHGEKAAQIAAPVKEGYTFDGWYSDEDYQNEFNFSDPITKDTTIYGKFDINKFKVTAPTVPANAGWSTTATDATVNYNDSYEFTITVAKGYDASNMTVGVNGLLLAPKTSEQKDDGTVVYSYQISAIQSDMEITVSGVVRRTVTITYNDNGGTGGPVQQVVNYYLNGAGDNGEITDVTPTRVGYTFKGWATTNDAADEEYAAGETADFTADTVLYAVWEAKGTTVTLAADKNEQYEGRTVTLTATVTDGTNPVTSGSVEFFQNNTSLGTAQVNGGQATFQAVTSAYSTAQDAANTDTYYAKFIPSGSYDEGRSSEATVAILSTAITWAVNGNQLVIISGSEAVDSMTAGQTYTLKIPDVYALDDDDIALTFGTDYTVTWEKKISNQDWESVGIGGQTLTVTSYQAGDVYRAKVIPAAPYTKAYGENDTFTAYLVTESTGAVAAQATTTTIGVAKTNDVNNTPAQFEGETVLLYAQVFELNGTDTGNVIPGAGTVSFYRGEINESKLVGTVSVNEKGYATLEDVPISAYDPTGTNTTDTFYAVFNGSAAYAGSKTDTPASVLIRSTAIAWTTDGGKEQNKLLVYRGNSTDSGDRLDNQDSFTMLAGSTYTLKIPTVQEQGQNDVQLAYTTGYTITWYEIDRSGNAAEISHTSGDTVVVTPATSGVRYYAEIHPAVGSHYTDAWQDGKPVTHLTTATGEDNYTSAEAETVTDLSIAGAEPVTGGTADWEQYGGKTLTLTASVKVKSPQGGAPLDNPVINRGVVNFYVFGLDGEGKPVAKRIGNDAVNLTNGTASVTYTVPLYSLGDGLANILYFYAEYSDVSTSSDGSVLYGDSNSTTVASDTITTNDIPTDNRVQILSTAISWALEGTDDSYQVATDASAITVKDSTGQPATSMTAGETYTLTISGVYAFDQAVDRGTPLTAGTDYTVTWQIRDDQGSWTTYDGLTGKTTNSVDVTPTKSGATFRAVIYPVGGSNTEYTTAAAYEGVYEGEVTGLMGTVLYSAPTAEIDQQATTTTLTITGADTEDGDVWINGSTSVFTDTHLAQFEGQKVTLVATVTDGANPVASGSVLFYRYVDGKTDELVSSTAVEVAPNGVASIEAVISAYSAKGGAAANADRFYAVYQANDAYSQSASTTQDGSGAYQQPNAAVYIKSTTIDIPVIISENAGTNGAKETTKNSDLEGLQSGVQHTFTLKTTAGTAGATEAYSVVALDGRVVDSANYTIAWYANHGAGEEAVSTANTEKYVVNDTEAGSAYHIHLIPTGDIMKHGVLADGSIGSFAESRKAIIGNRQDVNVTVTASDKIAFTRDVTDVYQCNDITLTATVEPTVSSASAKPSGSVTFYYSADNGTTWTQLEDAVELKASATGEMVATLTTTELPVTEGANVKQTLVIAAVYHGDTTFKSSAEYNAAEQEITGLEDDAKKDVTVYSSAVKVNATYENQVVSVTEAPTRDMGIIAYVDGGIFTANSPATVQLTDVYTLDYDDADENVANTLAKLTLGVDYTIQWQKLTSADSWREGSGYKAGAPWSNIQGATTASYRIDSVEQGTAYRAMITILDTDKVQASYQQVDQGTVGTDDVNDGHRHYYSNILQATASEMALTVATTTDRQGENNEGIVEGEAVTIHTYLAGAGGVVPIASVSATITTQSGESVWTDTFSTVNGYAAMTWADGVEPGVYTLTVTAKPTNGYDTQRITRTLIVRDDSYSIQVSGETVTYNGGIQGVDVTISGMTLETELADKSWTVKYYSDASRTQQVLPIQAGTYYYTVTLPGSAYWTEKSVEGTFTIAKRGVTIQDLVAQAKVYDGTTSADLLEVVLNDAAIDADGLPTGTTGVINGDSLYVSGTGTTTAAAGTVQLKVENPVLRGGDAANYTLTNPGYTENFTIQRSEVQGDIADATFQYTGSDIYLPADDIYLIDQQGIEITDYEVLYYYFNGEGVEQVEAMNRKGQYLVVAQPDQTCYTGGPRQIVQVVESGAVSAEPSKDFSSSVIHIGNTVEVYGSTSGIQATATGGAQVTTYYYVSGSWTTDRPTNAGRYLVKVTAKTAQQTDTAYGLYTIVKARPNISLTLEEPTVTYDSALHDGGSKIISGQPADATVYYSYSGDVVIGESSEQGVNVAYQGQHDAGSYVVTAHVGETANYTAHEASAVLTIEKAPLTITADDLQRQQYDAYPDMVASYDGLATGGVTPDTSLRDVQIQPEMHMVSGDGFNVDMTTVGSIDIVPMSALAKNYNVTYKSGAYTTNAAAPNPELAIHGLPENGSQRADDQRDVVVYVGDVIQLYAYGTQAGRTINTSSVLDWDIDNTNVATVDGQGKLTVEAAGTFTVTLTRGVGTEAITTTAYVTAKEREVKVIVPSEDVMYTGNAQTYSGSAAVVDAYKIDEIISSVTPTVTDVSLTDSGSDTVAVSAGDQYEAAAARFTVNDAEATVTATDTTAVYGNKAGGVGYAVDPTEALTDGKAVSIAEIYGNLDVGSYEILVAGTENPNYNVKYATGRNAAKVTVTPAQATITTGSYGGNVGVTGGSVDGEYPPEGVVFDTSKTLGTNNTRMYGEPNWVMGYQITGLIDGDSVADMIGALEKLVDFDYNIGADANLAYPNKALMSGKTDYSITNQMTCGNYTVTVTKGTQNVYQRPVTLKLLGGQTLSLLYANLKGMTEEQQKEAVRKLLLQNLSVEKYVENGQEIGGLATLLGHTAQDLDYAIDITGDIDSGYTVTIQATGNYWSEPTVFEVNVVKQGYVVEYDDNNFTQTSAKVTLYLVDADGVRTASHLPSGDELYLEIYERLDGDAENDKGYAYYKENATDTVVRVKMTAVNGQPGVYTATYDKLAGGVYYRYFAIPGGDGYVIVG